MFGNDNSPQFVAQKIISACHAGSKQEQVNECYLFLTSSSVEEVETSVKKLLEKAFLRQTRVREIAEEVEQRISEDTIIFEGDDSWSVSMLGPAASKVCHVHKKPVFLYSEKDDYCQGGVRTPKGIDGVKAMIYCSKFLETYGGHPQAAGFRTSKENLEKFKTCLIEYFKDL